MFNFCQKITLFNFFSRVFKMAESYFTGNMKQQVIKSDLGNSRYFKMSPGVVSAVKNSLRNFKCSGSQNS